MESNNKKSLFSKCITIVLIVFIITLIILSFIKSDKPFIITSEIIICLGILVVLSLSDIFDNINIGKFLSLQRNIKKLNDEKSKLQEEKNNLINQILNIKNENIQNISITMTGTKNIEDIKNIEDAKNLEKTLSLGIVNPFVKNTHKEGISPKIEEYISGEVLEVISLQKVMSELNENAENQYGVHAIINYQKQLLSKNRNKKFLFDAYSHFEENDIFYEVKRILAPAFISRIEEILDLIKNYGEINNTKAKFVLIIPTIEKKDIGTDNKKNINLLKNEYKEAIENKLLEIKEINITKKDIEKYRNKR